MLTGFSYIITPESDRIFGSGGLPLQNADYDFFELVDTDNVLTFKQMNNMNYSRYMHSMCCVDSNKIIITGSMLDEIVSKKCESYDITKNVF